MQRDKNTDGKVRKTGTKRGNWAEKGRQEGTVMQRTRREGRKRGNWVEEGEGIGLGRKREAEMGGKG